MDAAREKIVVRLKHGARSLLWRGVVFKPRKKYRIPGKLWEEARERFELVETEKGE